MKYKRTILGMSEQFFYVHLKFTPKSVSLAAPIGNPHEIVVEVPRGLLNQRQLDLVGQDFTEKAIALDIARDVALKTATPFPATVRGPKYVVKKGKTPVWSREDAKTLLDSIPKDSVSGLRDRALIAGH
jgi:hypothetical protein